MSLVNGIITGNVHIDDIRQAIGNASGDIQTLCMFVDGFKMLSRKHPIRGAIAGASDTMEELSNSDFMRRNLGYEIPVFPGSSMVSVMKGIINNNFQWSTLIGATGNDISIGNGWLYKALRADTDFARYTDFLNYDMNQPRKYTEDTFVSTDDAKIIGGKNTAVAPKFWTAMAPYHPRNFWSLSDTTGGQHALGVAFWSPDALTSSVYYYVGTIVYLSTQWDNGQESENSYVLVSNSMFKKYLNLLPSQTSTIYAIGFFAPKNYAGWNNIDSNDSKYHGHNEMSNLRPLPGNGFATLVFQTSSGRNICMIDFTCNGSIMEPQTTYFTVSVSKIRNNYDDLQTTIVYLRKLKFSYVIYDANGNVKLDQKSLRIPYTSESTQINITNTGTSSNITHTTADVDLVKGINVSDRSQVVDGYHIRVYLWYLTGNSVVDVQEDYFQCGECRVTIGTPQREI